MDWTGITLSLYLLVLHFFIHVCWLGYILLLNLIWFLFLRKIKFICFGWLTAYCFLLRHATWNIVVLFQCNICCVDHLSHNPPHWLHNYHTTQFVKAYLQHKLLGENWNWLHRAPRWRKPSRGLDWNCQEMGIGTLETAFAQCGTALNIFMCYSIVIYDFGQSQNSEPTTV